MAGFTYVEEGRWVSVYKGPSPGFFHIRHGSVRSIDIKWRVHFTSPWFYTDGSVRIDTGETNFAGYGLPSPYADIEIYSSESALFEITN